MKKHILFPHFHKSTLSLILPLIMYTHTANSAPIFEEMVLHTMLESTSSVFTTLADYSILNPDGITNGSSSIGGNGISWTGSYNDSGWAYSGVGIFGGAALSMNYSGSLSGSDGTDITVSALGNGFLGTQPLLMNGSTTWIYDAGSDDYLGMDFTQETKIGSNSWWGWVLGGEIVAGVGAGVVSGIIAGGAITLGTGGVGAPAGVGVGVKTGATVGGVATVATTTISNNAKSILSDKKQPPPAKPTRPVVLSDIDLYDINNQGTLVADNGGLYADDPFGSYRSTGNYTGGTFSGTTNSVPEPNSFWLLLIGTIGFFSIRKNTFKFAVNLA